MALSYNLLRDKFNPPTLKPDGRLIRRQNRQGHWWQLRLRL